MWQRPRIGLHVTPGGVSAYDLRQRTALGAFASLDAALQPLERSRARLHVVLSDAHCRYLVMPRPAGIRNRAELTAAVHNRFRAVFGDSDTWDLQLGPSARGEHDFVSAVDKAVATGIEARARAAGFSVVSMRPQWVAWARHFRRELRRGNHWVVGTDGAWASIGYVSRGQCRQARALRLDGHVSLDDLLARERAFVVDDDPDATVWLGGTETGASSGAALTTAGPGALWGIVR